MTLAHNAGIRVIELPSCRMACSVGASLEAFDKWWTEIDKKRTDKFYPRDFMYHDAKENRLVWLYAMPPEHPSLSGYPLVDFDGGLFAAAVSVDNDEADGERVYGLIKEWIHHSGYFALDESERRHTLFHVITSDAAYAKMKFRQLDIYVPIR